jgi:hypothetical protein
MGIKGGMEGGRWPEGEALSSPGIGGIASTIVMKFLSIYSATIIFRS